MRVSGEVRKSLKFPLKSRFQTEDASFFRSFVKYIKKKKVLRSEATNVQHFAPSEAQADEGPRHRAQQRECALLETEMHQTNR